MTLNYANPDRIALIHKLRETIFLNPEDVSSRLIAADWFDENGEPDRAEALRAICRHISHHEKIGGTAGAPFQKWLDLRKKYDVDVASMLTLRIATYIKYDMDLSPPVIRISEFHHPRWLRISGFFSRIGITWGNWIEYGDEILSIEPIQLVEFTDTPYLTRKNSRSRWEIRSGSDPEERGFFDGEGRYVNIFRREFKKQWPYLEFVAPSFTSRSK